MLSKEKYSSGFKKFEKTAKKYVENPEKLNKLLKKTRKKANHNKVSLASVWNDFLLLIELIKAWSKGQYRQISKKSIVLIVATILYFLSPIDIIPDFLVGFGILDDAAVISFAIKQLADEIEKYRSWKQKIDSNID